MTAFPNSSRYIPLRSGPFSMRFDCQTGGLRTIQWGETCVWRELVVLVRDRQWQTIPVRLQILDQVIADDCFSVRIAGTHLCDDIDFRWSGSISGDRSGKISYAFEGEAFRSFAANRIGFCLLHPCLECAGRPIRQTRSDGRTVTGHFPCLIEPQIVGQYSICNLTGLAHQVRDELWAEALFTGEIFETEDQRNWTDASFKTYCPPLDQPIPLIFQPGERRRQTVLLQTQRAYNGVHQVANASGIRGDVIPAVRSQANFVRIRQAAEAKLRLMPKLGIGLAAYGQPPPDSVSQLCKELGANYLRWDLIVPSGPFAGSESAQRFAAALMCAAGADCALELAIHLPRDGMFDSRGLADELRRHQAHFDRLSIYRRGTLVTLKVDLAAIRLALPKFSVPIGGGSNANFCDWNREHALGRFPAEIADFLCWGSNPQVHATDDLSLMETVQALPAVVETARQRAGGLPLVVSPITLLPRFNAVASAALQNDLAVPPSDPRQQLQINAAWSVATWHALATAGVHAMTWFEAFGSRGFAGERSVSTGCASGLATEMYPVAACFRDLLQTRPQSVKGTESSANLSAVVLRGPLGTYLSVVNLRARATSITLELENSPTAKHNELTQVSLAPYDVRLIQLTFVK